MSELDVALSQLYGLEGALAITSPISTRIKKVWPYVPPMSKVITDTPCILHRWTLPELQLHPALMRETFIVNIRLLVHDADTPRAAEIATAFWPQIRTMLSHNVKLGLAGWSLGPIQGAEPTLTVFTEYEDGSGLNCLGLNLNLTLYHNMAASNAAGTPPA